MTKLAIAENPSFKAIDWEIEREGNTYSYETLEMLQKQYPNDRFYFIVGADCLFGMENWKNPHRLFKACTLAAAMRNEVSLTAMEEKKLELEQKFDAHIILIPFISMSISSTQIRNRIQEGLSVRYLLPEKVLNHIKEKGFYREKIES